jgi:hypothetical protein
MKNLNPNSFLKVCSGIAIVMLSVSALFFSVKTAEASPSRNLNYPMPVGNGKYMYSYTVDQAQNGDFFWHVMVWNTETGSFKCYYWNRGEWVENFEKALPALP